MNAVQSSETESERGASALEVTLRRHAWVGVSLAAHALLLGVFALAPPRAEPFSLERDDVYSLAGRYLVSRAEASPREGTAPEPSDDEAAPAWAGDPNAVAGLDWGGGYRLAGPNPGDGVVIEDLLEVLIPPRPDRGIRAFCAPPGPTSPWADRPPRHCCGQNQVSTEGLRVTGHPRVEGALSSETLRGIVERHLEEVRFCYARGLAERPRLRGRVIVSWNLDPSGRASNITVTNSPSGADAVEDCLVAAVRRWSFPSRDDGSRVRVSYRLRPALAGR